MFDLKKTIRVNTRHISQYTGTYALKHPVMANYIVIDKRFFRSSRRMSFL